MDQHVATQSTGESQINQINLWMRQQPWYIEFFRSKGLNPNQVKLTDQQRNELTMIATRNGVQLGDRMKIDSAGNVNQMGGFAGMPTWAKVAIGAAPVAGAMLIPGVREATINSLGSVFGTGGGTGAASGAGTATSTGIPTIGSTALTTGMGYGPPSLAGTSALTGVATSVPTLASTSLTSGLGYNPTSLAGTSPLGGEAALPTIPSRPIGNGSGQDPASLAGTSAIPPIVGRSVLDNSGRLGDSLTDRATDTGIEALLRMLPGLAGILPALMANGESEADKALKQKQLDLLALQEGRIKEQAPLFSDVQHMTRAMLPIFGRTS